MYGLEISTLQLFELTQKENYCTFRSLGVCSANCVNGGSVRCYITSSTL